MTKELWINLPVKDIKRSIEFFTAIGFAFKTDSPGFTPVSAPMMVGTKQVAVMLFEEATFAGICVNKVADTNQGTEVMFSFDAESRGEVDELAVKIKAAGGKMFSEPSEVQGWMYGCAFADPDGHRWNVLHMKF